MGEITSQSPELTNARQKILWFTHWHRIQNNGSFRDLFLNSITSIAGQAFNDLTFLSYL